MSQSYWALTESNAVIPTQWPLEYLGIYNVYNPMKISFDQGDEGFTFFGVSFLIVLLYFLLLFTKIL